MKKLLHMAMTAGAFILLNVVSTHAQAQEPCADPFRYDLMGPATISFNPRVDVGSTLWSGAVSAVSSGGGCTVPSATYTMYFEGTAGQAGTQLYETGIPGIAYRLKFGAFCTTNWWPAQCTMKFGALAVFSHALTIELVKTGPITGGGVLTGTYGKWFGGAARHVYKVYSWSGATTLRPIVPTCAVMSESRSISVGLGDGIPARTFTGMGTHSTAAPFHIALQCAGGDEGKTTGVHVTLTDQTNPANRSNILSLTRDSTATGIGIQVLKDSTVLSFGPDSSEAGNMNQWSAGEAANGVFTIPLSARYVQNDWLVRGGKASGRATFTMSYQ